MFRSLPPKFLAKASQYKHKFGISITPPVPTFCLYGSCMTNAGGVLVNVGNHARQSRLHKSSLNSPTIASVFGFPGIWNSSVSESKLYFGEEIHSHQNKHGKMDPSCLLNIHEPVIQGATTLPGILRLSSTKGGR